MKKELVVLVDHRNRKIGVEEKIRAHETGALHRAFSVFIFNSREELLIQQRAATKYHSNGLWSNTVCSHPRPGETYRAAVHRRLQEEMGFDCKIKRLFCFIYNAGFHNGLIENEYDCVFIGKHDGEPRPDPREIMDWQWISLKKLRQDLARDPGRYSVWLKLALDRMELVHIHDVVYGPLRNGHRNV